MRKSFFLPICVLVVLMLYGRSLNYDFVFDDHERIVSNDAIRTLNNPLRFFTDPSTQARLTSLSQDTFRPLVTLNFAVDYQLSELRPFFYRLENLLLHAFNGWLIILFGFYVFGLSGPGALSASLYFLFHPVQVESVVWISSRSDLAVTSWILLAVLAWHRWKNNPTPMRLVFVYVAYSAALLTREVAVCVPLAIILIDTLDGSTTVIFKKYKLHYLGFALVALGYFFIRWKLLGEVSQGNYWGGSWFTNICNVFQVWPIYLRLLFWPDALRVDYSSIGIARSLAEIPVIIGLIFFLLYLLLMFRTLQHSKTISVLLSLFLLFWLPGSNIIPIATQFAERLMYPLMIFAGLVFGLCVERGFTRPKNIRFPSIYIGVGLIMLAVLTVRQIPVWKNDITLWQNAIKVAPAAVYPWAMYGRAQEMQATREMQVSEIKPLLLGAKEAYIAALKRRPTENLGGALFFHLASVCLRLGEKEQALEFARRALILRPDLKPQWSAELIRHGIDHASLQ